MLKNRVALVTGASSGIGRVVAIELARLGADVLITSNESKRILDTLEELRTLNPNADAVEADVTSLPCLEEVVKHGLEKFQKIDILVNNAGITRDNLMIRMSDDDWYRVINTNLNSIFQLTRLVVRPMMKARFGRIINIASVVGFTGNPGQCNYTAAKAGLIGFSKSLAMEVAPRNITVNCVAPGFIQTPMTEKLKPEARQSILSRIPLGRAGQPEEVAAAVAFLASDQAGYITGSTLHINGGMYMA